MRYTHTTEILDNLLTLIDQDGNGIDAYEMKNLPATIDTIRFWRTMYAFRTENAIEIVSQYFKECE